jgi:hypothetical protein
MFLMMFCWFLYSYGDEMRCLLVFNNVNENDYLGIIR